MFGVTFFTLLLFMRKDVVFSVRIVELRVPTHEREGGVALLGCHYDMEGDFLYALKWYKDDEEFFRYAPSNIPSLMHFDKNGVSVDMARSSDTVVALVNLTQESTGRYKCEISGEAPSFQSTAKEKNVTIQLVPQGGPRLSGGKDKYFLDELVVMNCTSPASRPEAHLKWLVNNVEVSNERVYGPWYSVLPDRPDAVEVTLQLRFYASSSDFMDRVMRIKSWQAQLEGETAVAIVKPNTAKSIGNCASQKVDPGFLQCQSTIATTYQRETVSIHHLALPFIDQPDKPTQGPGSTDDSTALRNAVLPLLISVGAVIIL